jgi:formate dehydrogenase beta subunit
VEGREEMLADPFEITEAEEEGVTIHNHLAPRRILGEGGRATGLETLDVARAFDEQDRFNPQLVPDTARVWECDSVIVAIGQASDLGWMRPEDGLEVTPRGSLAVNKETLATTAPGVFAGGDIAFGPRLIINAVADGQRAARGIHSYLQNVRPRLARKGFFTIIPRCDYPETGPLRNYLRWQRRQPISLPIERRIGVATVEQGFEESTAREQAGRCLICSINPVFEGELCILCNGCVDVCPTDCLKLVPVSAIGGDEQVAALVEGHGPEGSVSSAMLFDPTRCVRCGLCAARCPTEAVKMESFRFTEEIVFETQEPSGD